MTATLAAAAAVGCDHEYVVTIVDDELLEPLRGCYFCGDLRADVAAQLALAVPPAQRSPQCGWSASWRCYCATLEWTRTAIADHCPRHHEDLLAPPAFVRDLVEPVHFGARPVSRR